MKSPGTYNARRDNLEGFWKELFGYSRGIAVSMRSSRTSTSIGPKDVSCGEGEDVKNLILEFRPGPTQDMLVACLWSRWTLPGASDRRSATPSRPRWPSRSAKSVHRRHRRSPTRSSRSPVAGWWPARPSRPRARIVCGSDRARRPQASNKAHRSRSPEPGPPIASDTSASAKPEPSMACYNAAGEPPPSMGALPPMCTRRPIVVPPRRPASHRQQSCPPRSNPEVD